MIRRHPRSTPFPYTTLFRSEEERLLPHPVGDDLLEIRHELRVSITAAVRGRVRLPVAACVVCDLAQVAPGEDRKSTRLNFSHANISYAVFCLKKKKRQHHVT